MSNIRLRKEEFRRWLEANLDVEFDCNSANTCPIARYLTRASFGPQHVMVEEHGIEFGDEWIPTPPWASAFICAFDDIGGLGDRAFGAQALEVLGDNDEQVAA